MSMNIAGGSAGNVFRVPMSLVAPSREQLTQLCILNNLEHSTEFRYFDIQLTNEGWVAWFNVEIPKENLIIFEKVKDGTTR